MPKAQLGDTVRVRYTGRLDNGQVFDSTEGGPPFEFTIGGREVIASFEKAVTGLQPGESVTVRVPAAEAYGVRSRDMVTTAPLEGFPQLRNAEVGERLKVRLTGGQAVAVTVTQKTSSSVTLDANHPLAGQDLTFHIELVEIV